MSQKKKANVGILGIGSYVPEKILNNSDLEKMVETSDEWIVKRTGISERRLLEKGLPIYTLGIKAAENALKDSGIKAEELGMIIVVSSTPDYMTPTASSQIQSAIGASNAATFDMVAACTGFIYGITTAMQFVETGYYDYVMVVSNEGMSRVTDYTDRNNCILFGDAGGAVVLGRVEEGYGIISTYIASDGTNGKSITIPSLFLPEEELVKREKYENKKAIWQDGSEVFKFAV
ncbi:MAG: beta-ketoacyl-ACP synthase 3, partial [Clostridiales bacterium]|nr:beta-ketoacyl-ACP synthase 3 [Clostridiales bacterium]